MVNRDELPQENTQLRERIDTIKISCGLQSQQFSFVTKTLQFIVKRSSNFIMKPTKLQSDLRDKIGLSEPKTEIFLNFWIGETKPILDNLDVPGSVSTRKLENISWNLRAQLSSGGQQKEKSALGHVQLQTTGSETINLNVNHDELLQMYYQLENIQGELDLLIK